MYSHDPYTCVYDHVVCKHLLASMSVLKSLGIMENIQPLFRDTRMINSPAKLAIVKLVMSYENFLYTSPLKRLYCCHILLCIVHVWKRLIQAVISACMQMYISLWYCCIFFLKFQTYFYSLLISFVLHVAMIFACCRWLSA